ncbi:MAG TPA: proline--tRNA ligase [Thermoprotei archaeon]|nr:proline--tRNA ligase [Thermoprotei archaeon]
MGLEKSQIEEKLPDKSRFMSEWYDTVLYEAGIIDIRYGVKGFIVYMPYGMKIMKNIIKLFEEELEATGHEPVLFPVVIHEENLRKESEHITGFESEVFWITHAGRNKLEEKLALRPTSETAMYPLYSLWLKSYKDLPFKAYQTVAVYRYETKATRPLLRGREFLWIEAHDVFRTRDEAIRQTIEDKEIFYKITYEKLGIPFIHVKREEFDKFPGAEDTYAFDTLLPDGKVLQIGTTHYLGQKFSRVFDVKFHDVDGEYRYGEQTCYGIGLSRILASILLIHGDNYGLILPFDIAPIQIVIIPIYRKDYENDKINKYATEVEELLKGKYRVKLDLTDKTPGEKFYQYDLLGIPIRIEIGMKEVDRNTVTIFRRDLRERREIKLTQLHNYIEISRKEIVEVLRRRAEERLTKSYTYINSIEDIEKYADMGYSLFEAEFCDNEECANELKATTGGYEVRGIFLDKKVGEGSRCIMCGGEARSKVLIAKAY